MYTDVFIAFDTVYYLNVFDQVRHNFDFNGDVKLSQSNVYNVEKCGQVSFYYQARIYWIFCNGLEN